MRMRLLNMTWSNLRFNVRRSFVTMATNLPFCFFIQFLEQLLKFLANFTSLKYVKSQRSYGFKSSLLSLLKLNSFPHNSILLRFTNKTSICVLIQIKCLCWTMMFVSPAHTDISTILGPFPQFCTPCELSLAIKTCSHLKLNFLNWNRTVDTSLHKETLCWHRKTSGYTR